MAHPVYGHVFKKSSAHEFSSECEIVYIAIDGLSYWYEIRPNWMNHNAWTKNNYEYFNRFVRSKCSHTSNLIFWTHLYITAILIEKV